MTVDFENSGRSTIQTGSPDQRYKKILCIEDIGAPEIS